MPRPQKKRTVAEPPKYNGFKPVGIRRYKLPMVYLTLDEYEAIRLTDLLGKEHAECAEIMNISRSTFTRLAEKARTKVAEFIVMGKQLQIEGGSIHFKRNKYKCKNCGEYFSSPIEEELTECPECGSEEITNMASDHGHGECCKEYNEQEKI